MSLYRTVQHMTIASKTNGSRHIDALPEAVFSMDLIRKYNRPGPRYTSYPTAPHFRGDMDPDLLIGALRDPAAAERPLSLYLHLPFCESNCWFCGCTKIITRDHSSADRYLDYLEKEVSLIAKLIDPNRQVVQLHLGGGTPTFFSAEQLERLGRILKSTFIFHPESENGVEIDPRHLNPEQVKALRSLGFNRASLGVQDNNPEVQKAVHRIQPMEMTAQSVQWLRDEGFQSINLDLIYGLPLQTEEGFAQTVNDILTLRPDRIALFSYAHVPWIKPSQKIFDKKNNLPDSDTKLAILKQTCAQLAEHGYLYIGMDHFALEHDDLVQAQRSHRLQRNFQGYSTQAGADICGLGMSAISQTADTYRQNAKDLLVYYKSLDEGRLPVTGGYILTHDDHIRRETIMRIMCDLKLSFADLSAKLDIDFPEYFKNEIQALTPMAEDGLVEISSESIQVTPVGRFLIRNIAMCFDAYLERKQARYSKTI